jgi:hypothetical protein
MKLFAAGLLVAIVLFAGGFSLGMKNGKTYMDMNVLVGSIKESVNAEEKHTEFIWYKACPDRISGVLKPPKVLMVYPVNFDLKTSIDEATYVKTPAGKVRIHFAPIRIENTEPYLEQMVYMSSGGLFYQKGDRYVQAEINRAPRIIKFLAYQTLKDNLAEIRRKMAEKVKKVFASALKNDITSDNIECLWDDAAQKKYLEALAKDLVQPPFGAKGCESNWFHVGNKAYNYIVQDHSSKDDGAASSDAAPDETGRPEKIVLGVPMGQQR